MNRFITIFILLLPFMAVAQTVGTPIFKIESNGMISYDQQFSRDYGNPNLPSKYTAPIVAGYVYVPTMNYLVATYRFKGWENEPGDFDIFEIRIGNQMVFSFRDGDGLLKYRGSRYPSSKMNYASQFANLVSNDYYMEVPLSPSNAKALIFLGKPYGTDLPKLIIMAITPNSVKLVYYKQMQVNSIIKTDNEFKMILQSNIQECNGNGSPVSPAITHTIWREDGVLKFKDN